MAVNLGSRRVTRFFAVVSALLSIATVYSIWQLRMDFNASEEQRKVSEQKQTATADIAGQLSDQVAKLGADPVVPKSEIERITGEEGAPGRPPTPSEVSSAVARFCSLGACDGEDASASQVSAAVTLYCSARGSCKGPTGSRGGEGPPPTSSQVAGAVIAYCMTRNMCVGQTGPTGAQGADGAQGPKGADGANGAQGEQGAKGEQGADGAQGPKGADGAQGPKGDKGDTGEAGVPGAIQNVVVSPSCTNGPFGTIISSEPVNGVVTISCTPAAAAPPSS